MTSEIKGNGLLPRVYDDLVHPSACKIGESVERAVRLALAPIDGALWSAEKALEWLVKEVKERFRNDRTQVEPCSPQPYILAATISGVCIVGDEPVLAALFANLLTSAMHPDRASKAHPAFAEIIRQLQSDEARILEMLYRDCHCCPIRWGTKTKYSANSRPVSWLEERAGVQFSDRRNLYLGNLKRLGLVKEFTQEYNPPYPIKLNEWIETEDRETRLFSDPDCWWSVKAEIAIEHSSQFHKEMKGLLPTDFGIQYDVVDLEIFGYDFMRACGR